MSIGFPPVPLYPQALDSDYTLFLVYNTSEAELASNNEAWAEEIEIEPVSAESNEIWADNGFANISGELFYYDEVEKDSNDKVYKLKRCARNLGGSKTKFNESGSMVRGFVVAEHHNQLADGPSGKTYLTFLFPLYSLYESINKENNSSSRVPLSYFSTTIAFTFFT